MFRDVFYINLPHREQRRKNMEAQVPWAKKIDGIIIDEDDIDSYKVFPYILQHPKRVIAGTIGCYLAHKKTLEYVQSLNTTEPCVIFEDDVVIKASNFWDVVHEHVTSCKSQCDILMIDTIGNALKQDKVSDNLYKPSCIWPTYWGAHCYVVMGSKAASNVLGVLSSFPVTDIDTMYLRHCNSLVCKPGICIQDNSSSDRTC